jgi:hypothetical protein
MPATVHQPCHRPPCPGEARRHTDSARFDETTAARIQTRFVRDRLAEAAFHERGWIAELVHWEAANQAKAKGKNLGWAGSMWYAGGMRHFGAPEKLPGPSWMLLCRGSVSWWTAQRRAPGSRSCWGASAWRHRHTATTRHRGCRRCPLLRSALGQHLTDDSPRPFGHAPRGHPTPRRQLPPPSQRRRLRPLPRDAPAALHSADPCPAPDPGPGRLTPARPFPDHPSAWRGVPASEPSAAVGTVASTRTVGRRRA